MAAAPMVAGRRLFSNLATVNSADGRVVLRHEPGSVQGAIALVAGTTVGAGILALPAVTHESGVLPSGCVIIGAWAFMCATGLLLAEVRLQHGRSASRASSGMRSRRHCARTSAVIRTGN